MELYAIRENEFVVLMLFTAHYKHKWRFEEKIIKVYIFKKNLSSYCWKVEEKFSLLYSTFVFFILCIFIDRQAYENEHISGYQQILHKTRYKKKVK